MDIYYKDWGAGSQRCYPGWPFDRRRGGPSLHRPPWREAGRRGHADRCGSTLDAKAPGQSRRRPTRGIRRRSGSVPADHPDRRIRSRQKLFGGAILKIYTVRPMAWPKRMATGLTPI